MGNFHFLFFFSDYLVFVIVLSMHYFISMMANCLIISTPKKKQEKLILSGFSFYVVERLKDELTTSRKNKSLIHSSNLIYASHSIR